MAVFSSFRAQVAFAIIGSSFVLAGPTHARQTQTHGDIDGIVSSERPYAGPDCSAAPPNSPSEPGAASACTINVNDNRLQVPLNSYPTNGVGAASINLAAAYGGSAADHVLTDSGKYLQRDASLAFGVNPFLKPRPQMIDGQLQYFRTDFAGQMTHPANWNDISHIVGEYEMFIEALQGAAAYPADFNPSALATALNSRHMTVTFLVGGARPINRACSGSGRAAAQMDITLLKTWQNVGGHIDKLIADNAFKRYFASTDPGCYSNPDQFMRLVAAELASYFGAMHQAFPAIRFGATDGFARFEVTDPTGAQGDAPLSYSATVAMPIFSFRTYLGDLLKSMRANGLTLDEFVMDCAEAYTFDARYRESKYIYRSRNYGRMMAGQKIMDSMGVGSGVYWEVFPAKSAPDKDQQYHDLGLEQLKAFYRFGGHPRHNRFTYWTSAPSITGPETVPNTALNDIYDSARAAATLDAR